VTPTYKLEELAAEAGVSPRTVRYYVQRGLLPAPELRGKDTVYGREHLLRLQAIKRLQQSHLPLDEIQIRIASAAGRDLERLARGELATPPQGPVSEPHDSGSVKKGVHPYRSPARSVGAPDASSAPLPLPSSAEPAASASVYFIAPGVELLVRDGSPAPARALVREILDRYATSIEKDSDR